MSNNKYITDGFRYMMPRRTYTNSENLFKSMYATAAHELPRTISIEDIATLKQTLLFCEASVDEEVKVYIQDALAILERL